MLLLPLQQRFISIFCFIMPLSLCNALTPNHQMILAEDGHQHNYKQISVTIQMRPAYPKETYDTIAPSHFVDYIHINHIHYHSGAHRLLEYDFKELKQLLKEQMAFDPRPEHWKSHQRELPAPLLLILSPDMTHAQFKQVYKHLLSVARVMDIRLIGAEDDQFCRLHPNYRFLKDRPKHVVLKQADLPEVPKIKRQVRAPILRKSNTLEEPAPPTGLPSTQPAHSGVIGDKTHDPASTQPAPPTPPSKKSDASPSPSESAFEAAAHKKEPPRAKTYIYVYADKKNGSSYSIKHHPTPGKRKDVLDTLKEIMGPNGCLDELSPIAIQAENSVTLKQLIPFMHEIQALGYQDIRLTVNEPPAK